MSEREDPWGGQNPLGCCRDHVTEGGVPVHGGPGCIWPGIDREHTFTARPTNMGRS